jgi:hypothetical protein
MFSNSIEAPYNTQKRLFKRLISMAFTLAGIYWLFIYGAEWASLIDAEERTSLRSGQTIIYFILLTLWGVEYLRESKRLSHVIEVANGLGVTPQDVSMEQLTRKGAFSVLRPIKGSSPLMPAVNWLGLVISAVLIVMQYSRLIAAF